jgi:CIC family chloride channel protein
LSGIIKKQAEITDEGVLSVGLILLAIFVAMICGIAAFLLHLAVGFTGCLSGINGCHKRILLDLVESSGISQSLYFIMTCCLSGLVCDLIIHAPWKRKVAFKCKGGGSAGTKIVISAGQHVSGWVPLLRIVLAAIYLGGGNTLGTEGPIIHLAASLATWVLAMMGIRRRKMLSMFAVIGAAAGISAGFNVAITGFIFTIEELTRSLSRKSALVITLAAGVATLVKEQCERFLEQYVHRDHPDLAPLDELGKLSNSDIRICLLLCVPIGVLNGVAGWVFVRCACSVQAFLRRGTIGKSPTITIPQRSHLAIIGLISASLGALAYEVSGVNGVWGTTVGALPEIISKGLTWDKVALMFCCKFCAMILSTAGGGPGGSLVPSLAAGGLVGIVVARCCSCSEPSTAACAVIGMGSLFASVMHMPVTGVIMMFELTWAKDLIVHFIFANFIASNVVARLPGGSESYVHCSLHHDPVWLKLGGQDFIETDQQEQHALNSVGIGRIKQMSKGGVNWSFASASQKLRYVFEAWHHQAQSMGCQGRQELAALTAHRQRLIYRFLVATEADILRLGWSGFLNAYLTGLRMRSRPGCTIVSLDGDEVPSSKQQNGLERERNGLEDQNSLHVPQTLLVPQLDLASAPPSDTVIDLDRLADPQPDLSPSRITPIWGRDTGGTRINDIEKNPDTPCDLDKLSAALVEADIGLVCEPSVPPLPPPSPPPSSRSVPPPPTEPPP